MRELFIELTNWLVLRLDRPKFTEIEKFFLENYPPHTGFSILDGINCKLRRTTDLVKVLKENTGIEITTRQCALTLQHLGYKQVEAREPFTTDFYRYWVLK